MCDVNHQAPRCGLCQLVTLLWSAGDRLRVLEAQALANLREALLREVRSIREQPLYAAPDSNSKSKKGQIS
jgi:hypothetical protein